MKDGDIAIKNGVQYVYDKGIVPLDSDKIEKITNAKECIVMQLEDKKMVDVIIKEISWQKSLVAKDIDNTTLFVKFRLVDSDGVEYSTVAFGSLDFGVYLDNGVIKLRS